MFKFGNLNKSFSISRKFMSDHNIDYRYDIKNKMGCFQKMATYSLQCVWNSIAPNYKMKVEAELMEDGETKKRRRNLKDMEFDPKVNLKDPSKYKKSRVGTTVSRNTVIKNKDNEVNLEYKIKKGIVKKFDVYFKQNLGGSIMNVGEVRKVSTLFVIKILFTN